MKEVAKIVGIPENTLKRRLFYARMSWPICLGQAVWSKAGHDGNQE
ncbi:hypothetical protein [Tardiphaga sp. vice304]